MKLLFLFFAKNRKVNSLLLQMDASKLQKIRDQALNTNVHYSTCMEIIEKAKMESASLGSPYFEVRLRNTDEIPTSIIENVLNTLETQGFSRIFFSYPTDNGYGTKWVKYENDNFYYEVSYGTKVRVYF